MPPTARFAALLAAAAGCDRPPDPAPAPPTADRHKVAAVSAVRPAPRKPDAGRLRFNRQTRTLTVYPAAGRWMLRTPREPRGLPIAAAYEFPPNADAASAAVVLVGPDGRPSDPVSIAEIVAANEMK